MKRLGSFGERESPAKDKFPKHVRKKSKAINEEVNKPIWALGCEESGIHIRDPGEALRKALFCTTDTEESLTKGKVVPQETQEN